MKELTYADQYRITTVCVDGYENGVPDGRMYHYDLELNKGTSFHGTMEFLKRMESMMQKMNAPQPATERRVFQPNQMAMDAEQSPAGFQKGKVATFVIRVLFRQHTSWQGTVTWSEGKKEEKFRSVLELLLLMDSALGTENVKGNEDLT